MSVDLTAVQLDEMSHERQADAEAASPLADALAKSIEDERQQRHVDALSRIGDFDLDGDDDVLDYWIWTRSRLRTLAAPDFGLDIIDPPPSFPDCVQGTPNNRAMKVLTFHGVVADVTGDGHSDIVHCQASDNVIKLYRRTGRQSFASGVTLPSRGSCADESTAMEDLDGDGALDLLRKGARLAFHGESSATWEDEV